MEKIFSQQIRLHDNKKEAILIGFNGQNFSDKALGSLPQYKGSGFIATDKTITISYAQYRGQTLPITQIQSCSFSFCKEIETIKLASHIYKIEWNMFECNNLQNIEVEPNNDHYQSVDGVLFSKDRKELIGFPSGRTGEYRIPKGTTRICNCAFKSSKLSHIHIPNSIKHIGTNVFYECKNLKEIIVPTTLQSIEPNCDRAMEDIKQKFYFDNDVNKTNPMSIKDLIKKIGSKK